MSGREDYGEGVWCCWAIVRSAGRRPRSGAFAGTILGAVGSRPLSDAHLNAEMTIHAAHHRLERGLALLLSLGPTRLGFVHYGKMILETLTRRCLEFGAVGGVLPGFSRRVGGLLGFLLSERPKLRFKGHIRLQGFEGGSGINHLYKLFYNVANQSGNGAALSVSEGLKLLMSFRLKPNYRHLRQKGVFGVHLQGRLQCYLS